MQVIITPLAERDIESIGDYIAQDNPVRAISFVTEIRAQCVKIAKGPQGYGLRPEFTALWERVAGVHLAGGIGGGRFQGL